MKSGSVKGAKSYYYLDNRNSDVPIVQMMANGEVLVIPPGALVEMKSLTCAHCNFVVMLNPKRTRERAHCRRCNQYICGRPGCRAECNYIEEMVDISLAHPGQPMLQRDANGYPFFDRRLRDNRRIH